MRIESSRAQLSPHPFKQSKSCCVYNCPEEALWITWATYCPKNLGMNDRPSVVSLGQKEWTLYYNVNKRKEEINPLIGKSQHKFEE